MNKIISFVLGAVSMLVVILAIKFTFSNVESSGSQEINSNVSSEVSEPLKVEDKVDKKIAFVNNDLGIEGSNVNVASSLIDNMVPSPDYKLETTTYSDATAGLENNNYAAYIVFDSNYSSSLFNVTKDQLPTRAKINVRVNANLSQEQQTEVDKVLLNEYNYIHDTISYVYITYLLDEVHNSQNKIGTVIENEEYMNSIASSVSNYSTDIVKRFKDYLDKSEKTEIELDTTNIESLYEQNLKQVESVQGVDVDKIKTDIEGQQEQFMTTIAQSMLNRDMEPSKLDLVLKPTEFGSGANYPQSLNNLLINNTKVYNNVSLKLKSINDAISHAMLMIDGGDISVPDIENSKIIHVLETLVYTSLDGEYNFANIESLESDSTYEDTFNAVNGFILSYANWYNSNKGITPTVCTDNECFEDYNTTYSDKFPIWLEGYNNIKSDYKKITARIVTLITDTIPNIQSILTTSAENFVAPREQDYVNEILDEGETEEDNYNLVKNYCQLNPKPSTVVGQFGCSINNLAVGYVGVNRDNVEYNENIDKAQKAIEDYNEVNVQNVATQNQAVVDANTKVTEALVSRDTNLVNKAVSKGNEINSGVSTGIMEINKKLLGYNKSKDGFIDKTMKVLSGYEEQLNTSISNTEKSLYNDRKESSDAAKAYNNEYKPASNYYSSNVDSLKAFTSILPNTRNGAEANLYLYDYIVNPLDIALHTSDKTKDNTVASVSTEKSINNNNGTSDSKVKSKVAFKIILGVVVIVGVLLFVLLKTGDEEDE